MRSTLFRDGVTFHHGSAVFSEICLSRPSSLRMLTIAVTVGVASTLLAIFLYPHRELQAVTGAVVRTKRGLYADLTIPDRLVTQIAVGHSIQLVYHASQCQTTNDNPSAVTYTGTIVLLAGRPPFYQASVELKPTSIVDAYAATRLKPGDAVRAYIPGPNSSLLRWLFTRPRATTGSMD